MRCNECLRKFTEMPSATKRKDGSFYILFDCKHCDNKERIDTLDLRVSLSVVE